MGGAPTPVPSVEEKDVALPTAPPNGQTIHDKRHHQNPMFW